MTTAALGQTIIIAQMEGDRPAIVTKTFSNTSVEACAFLPLPERLKVVSLHPSRPEAINATQRDPIGYHGYWPAKG
jgi:hypothetical protein